MKKTILVIFIAFLVGCTNRIYVHDTGEQSGQLSIVKTLTGTKAKYNAWIHFVYDESGSEMTGRNAIFDGGLGEVHLPEGQYKFNVLCTNGSLEGNLELESFIRRSKKYQISCDVRESNKTLGFANAAKAELQIQEVK